MRLFVSVNNIWMWNVNDHLSTYYSCLLSNNVVLPILLRKMCAVCIFTICVRRVESFSFDVACLWNRLSARLVKKSMCFSSTCQCCHLRCFVYSGAYRLEKILSRAEIGRFQMFMRVPSNCPCCQSTRLTCELSVTSNINTNFTIQYVVLDAYWTLKLGY